MSLFAGTFDATNAADDESDKPIIRIAKDSHKVLRISATLPNLGGALLTSELVK